MAREMKDRDGEGKALGNLGNAYYCLSRYEKAIEYYKQSLAILQEVKNLKDQGTLLTDLGDAYYSLNRYEKAVEI